MSTSDTYNQSNTDDVTSPFDSRVCTDGDGLAYLCHHGGSCDYSDGFGCECTSDWVGENCETGKTKDTLASRHHIHCRLTGAHVL